MQVIWSTDTVPADLTGACLAIGNFDGVHRGHQAVIGAAQALAAERGTPAGALIFDPHPQRYFAPDVPFFSLSPLPLKLELLSALGLDVVAVLSFDAALAALTAEEFVAREIAGRLAARAVVAGADFHFGKGRGGTPKLLAELGRVHGFAVQLVAPVGEGEVFSSSRVRRLLAAGDVTTAARQLGHWWRVRGAVVDGAKRGAALGFPTANLALRPGQALRHGIYAAFAFVGGVRHAAAAYLGARPTFDSGAPVLEVYLLDFAGDLYGQAIEVAFIAHLRDDAAFASADALKAQMTRDVEAARIALAAIAAADPMLAYPIGRAQAAAALGG